MKKSSLILALVLGLFACEGDKPETSTNQTPGDSTPADNSCDSPYTIDGIALFNFDDGIPPSEFASGGDAQWFLDDTRAHSPPYSSGSGIILDGQVTGLLLYLGIPTRAIAFWYSVSSEPNDLMGVAIEFANGDVEVLGDASGEIDWTLACYTHAPGTVSYHWLYTKDGSGTSGVDAAWIDDVAVVPE